MGTSSFVGQPEGWTGVAGGRSGGLTGRAIDGATPPSAGDSRRLERAEAGDAPAGEVDAPRRRQWPALEARAQPLGDDPHGLARRDLVGERHVQRPPGGEVVETPL